MRFEWDRGELASPWAAAMGEHGDHWREALINPLALALCQAIATGADPFRLSAFAAALSALDGGQPEVPLDGLGVLDLGCGEGCLGRLLARQGARYLGVDRSTALLDIGRQRAAAAPGGERMRFAQVDFEAEAAGFPQLAAALAGQPAPALVSSIVVLDHLQEVAALLHRVGEWLAGLPAEVPFLCVTLAPERFAPSVATASRPGELAWQAETTVESCGRNVSVWLRARRTYERCFRDAGLFVRRCEPLYFHRRHAGKLAPDVPGARLPAADERDDVSRRPAFWAWLLSARRRTSAAVASITWPPGTDAAALQASVHGLGAAARAPVVYDVAPAEAIMRVHNMGGELFAVLSGAARMTDGAQELMTFQAGEVLGDLETPDASGQCGSFPFDVRAGAEGCRIAIFPEATAAAVLASSRDMGSRFFRLLRDRLRLALWHYEMREMVGEYLETGHERLEKRLLHRCARALLWAAAIESRGRTRTFHHEVAFIDPDTIARRFKPGTERIDFGLVIRQLHVLRLIDAFPGAAIRKEEEERASASWDQLVAAASRRFLAADLDARAQATVAAHGARLRVAGQLVKEGGRTRQFQEVVDDLGRLSLAADWRARLGHWSDYIARAHRFWEERNPWLIVLRDVPALRRIALEDAVTMEETLAARARYFLAETRRPTWEMVTARTSPARRCEYIAVFDELVAADLAAGGGLLFSSETTGAG